MTFLTSSSWAGSSVSIKNELKDYLNDLFRDGKVSINKEWIERILQCYLPALSVLQVSIKNELKDGLCSWSVQESAVSIKNELKGK